MRSAAAPLDLDGYVARIRGFDGPRFAVATEERINHGGRTHPILSVTSRARAPGQKTLLVLAGVHGDEQAGLLAVPHLLDAWTSGASEASERVRLVVITPVNPVGAAKMSRTNGDGHDINRDFVRFVTVEARLVRDVIDREKPDFVVSLHEGPQNGTFMFANRYVEKRIAHALCDALARGGTKLAKRDYFYRRLRQPGLAPSSRAQRALTTVWTLTLRSKATIGYSEDRGIPEIVLESHARVLDEDARVRPHVDVVKAVAALLAR